MKRVNILLCLFLSIILSSCSNRYYAVMLPIETQYAPCFGRDSIPSYMRENTKQDEIDQGLVRINKIMVNDMFPFLFKQTVPEDTNSLEAALRCDSSPKIKDNDVRAYVNFVSYLPKKEPEKSKESSPTTTAQKEMTKTEESCESRANDKNTCNKKITITTKLTEPVEKKATSVEEDTPFIQDINLVTSNYLYSLNRADRLEKAYTLVTPLHAGVEFVKIDSTVSYKMVNLGTESVKYGLSSSSGIPVGSSLGSAVTISPSVEKNIQRNIQKNYVLRNAEIFPLRNVLMISQDGGPADADISGNSEVTATIQIPTDLCRYITVFKIDELPTREVSAGYDSSSPELYLHSSSICHIEKVSALVASVSVARTVSGGKETIKEDDDVVTHRVFRNISIIDLWKNPDPLYQIEILYDNKMSHLLVGDPQSRTGTILTFRKFKDALTFRNLIFDRYNLLRKGMPVQVNKKDTKTNIFFGKSDVPMLVQALNIRICAAGVTTTFGQHDNCVE